MNVLIKVYLCGSENIGWALDADLAATLTALRRMPDLVTLTNSPAGADVVYSVWEYPVLQMSRNKLAGKRVVCQISNDFMRIHGEPVMIRSTEIIGMWVPMSRESLREVKILGYPHTYIPYAVDTTVFTRDVPENESIAAVRRRFSVPDNAFVISNFMRDSSGHDLLEPKMQKGAEMLVEMGRQLTAEGCRIHFLLAGPRRHWIRKQMAGYGVPYTYIGRETDTDDNDVNISPPYIINLLYHASDLHLVTSRWEGGPRAVLECAATRTPVLTTPVGLAPDILCPESLYASVAEGLEKIRRQIGADMLHGTLDKQYRRLTSNHVPEANVPRFRKLFERIGEIPPVREPVYSHKLGGPAGSLIGTITRKLGSVAGLKRKNNRLCICLWHEFHKPPYGGGNQFMMALSEALERLGVNVAVNRFSSAVDAHICNSAWFESRLFADKAGKHPFRMIHRIDGPTTLYRGHGSAEDDKIFALNREFASATVFQSAYCFRKSYELGYRAVAPVIIHNSVNSRIFNPEGREEFSEKRKIRLVSSSWSDNPRKGGPFLKWLDTKIDWDRYEYTFIGRVGEQFENIRHIPPKNSDELARLLRQHDIFVSVSQHEPCSNALLEALACGLPALYRNDGGNAELVSFAGLPFGGEEDVLARLDELVGNYSSFQRLIRVESIDDVALKYVNLALELMNNDA